MRANVLATADTNVMVKRRADTNKPVTDEALEMTIRELVIYRNNKRSIGFTKSFEKLAQNKLSLQAGPAATTKS